MITCILAVYIMHRKIVHRRNHRLVISRRIWNSVYGVQLFFALGFAFIIAELGISGLWGSSIMSARVNAELSADVEKQTIANNMDTLFLLQEDNWRELSLQQRLEVLTVVGIIEQHYLGLPYALNVCATDLPEHVLGYYDDSSYEIVINMSHLINGNPYSIIKTFLHEAYHSLECRWSEAYNDAGEEMQALILYQDAKAYSEELSNYCSGFEEDFDNYYNQQCEVDSRAYAEVRIQDYYDALNEYFGKNIVPESGYESAECRDEYTVEYGADGYAYLFDPMGECIAGPYLYIEEDLNWTWNKACRYIGINGLIGYLYNYAEEITPPKFIEACEFVDGVALVSEKEGSVYFIDDKGNRVTKDYVDAFSFEHQGNYARVMMEDGKWGIIDRYDEVVFSGADSINELPSVTVLGSAIVDGHAVLFQLGYSEENPFRIVKEYEQFVDISYIHRGDFAIVKDASGMYGVINWNGEIIVSANYKSIELEVIEVEEGACYAEQILFRLQNQDGSYSILKKEL